MPRVTARRQDAWSAPTLPGSGLNAAARENIHFPASPPKAAPAARGTPIFRSMCDSLLILLFTTEYAVIERTVQPDKKLITETSIIWKASNTGLMMTPPPIPQIAPMTDAQKQIAKKIKDTQKHGYIIKEETNITQNTVSLGIILVGKNIVCSNGTSMSI